MNTKNKHIENHEHELVRPSLASRIGILAGLKDPKNPEGYEVSFSHKEKIAMTLGAVALGVLSMVGINNAMNREDNYHRNIHEDRNTPDALVEPSQPSPDIPIDPKDFKLNN